MSDLISRQAAIDALKEEEYPCESDYDEGYMAALDKAVWIIEKWLSSAHPDVPDTNVGDMISRAAAIDAISASRMVYGGTWGKGLSMAADRLRELPSAQPEIIRCKDCKYRMPYDWMFSEIYRSRNIDDYSENEIGCQYCDMAMKADDYCSRAERREE